MIQSQHWIQLKESEKQITILTKLKLKGKWDENEIMFRRNNKEFCWILLSLNLIMTLIINPLYKVSSKEYSLLNVVLIHKYSFAIYYFRDLNR